MRMRGLSVVVILVLVFAAHTSAASVDGLPIHSSSSGRGRVTLVLVRGWTCDATSWAAQVPELAKRYRAWKSRTISTASSRPSWMN